MKEILNDQSLDQLFRQARSYPTWKDKPVSRETIQQLFDLAIMGPTSMNCLPARFVFIQSDEAKQRLLAGVAEGNIAKVETAPVTIIVAHDSRFYEHLPTLFPHAKDADKTFSGNQELAKATAFRNGSLQGAYMILAARALGLDVGPMSGFDNNKIDAEFFPDGRFKSNFLMNVGYGDDSGLFPRGPRFELEQAARLL